MSIQQFLIEPAYQRATADKRGAEADSFLFGKTNYFDAERKPSSPQLIKQRDSEHHSERAIISTGVRNRIEVRAYQEPRSVWPRSPIHCTKISGGIDSHFRSQRLHPVGKFLIAFTDGWRQECPARAAGIFRKRGQL